jgi:hypothetical protein
MEAPAQTRIRIQALIEEGLVALALEALQTANCRKKERTG